jgi:hypothetical protein
MSRRPWWINRQESNNIDWYEKTENQSLAICADGLYGKVISMWRIGRALVAS